MYSLPITAPIFTAVVSIHCLAPTPTQTRQLKARARLGVEWSGQEHPGVLDSNPLLSNVEPPAVVDGGGGMVV
jgi:hypothetical protein